MNAIYEETNDAFFLSSPIEPRYYKLKNSQVKTGPDLSFISSPESMFCINLFLQFLIFAFSLAGTGWWQEIFWLCCDFQVTSNKFAM